MGLDLELIGPNGNKEIVIESQKKDSQKKISCQNQKNYTRTGKKQEETLIQ